MDAKPNQITVTLTMYDVPVGLYKKFNKDVKTKFNNKYWAKLQDLISKAEAYEVLCDTLTKLGTIQNTPKPANEDELKDKTESEVLTFGGIQNG